MNKKDILKEVTEQTVLTHRQALAAYEVIIDTIKDALQKGKTVNIRGFATLKVIKTKERKIHHVRKQDIITIPSQSKICIKAAPHFKKEINQ